MDGTFLEVFPTKRRQARLLRHPPGMIYYPRSPKVEPYASARLRLLRLLRVMRGVQVLDADSIVVTDDPLPRYYVGVRNGATTDQISEQFWSIDPQVDAVSADFWRRHEIHVMVSVRSWPPDRIPPRLLESLWRFASVAAALHRWRKPKIRLTIVPHLPLLAGVRLTQSPNLRLARQITKEANRGAALLRREFNKILFRIAGQIGDHPVADCSILDPTHGPVTHWQQQQGSLDWLPDLLPTVAPEQWDSFVTENIANSSVGVSGVFGHGPRFVIGDSRIADPLVESARREGRYDLVKIAPLPMVWFHEPSGIYSADKVRDPYVGRYTSAQWEAIFRGFYAPWVRP
ncbi:hypothetical protein Acsp03_58540 [Actinomadura sp. NBRC 104412]|uniref:hypothetical protein n=1 Tax=Actinomadura sp. NBRC 104412 TaxID=3032203 RepID=UPI00249FED16|nr:hypothetical protein [Actinomadura sp. NBRC 104412]GLZ08388.1 hypothetical protein Acsp03_58540 [Actinomadura sp. NBRC 104412]